MSSTLENLLPYYNGSEVRITDRKHPHHNAVGKVIGGESTGIGYGFKIKRFDTQEEFFVFDPNHLKITKR